MSSPLIAKTETSNSSTSAAATSSWVESGFDAHTDVGAAGLERAHQHSRFRGAGEAVAVLAAVDRVAAAALHPLSSVTPSSNSWLPTEAICSPISFISSIVGSSWNAALTSGDAPIRSPAPTV